MMKPTITPSDVTNQNSGSHGCIARMSRPIMRKLMMGAMRPGTHEQFTANLQKQGIGSTIHCIAGDATGIILAAAVTITLGLPMWIDLIVEYVAGFAFGLLIFQSLFMM